MIPKMLKSTEYKWIYLTTL